MNTLIRALAATVAFALPFGCGFAAPSVEAQLRAGSLGRLKIGMTLENVNRHLKKKIIPASTGLRATANCDYNKLEDMPGVALVFIDNALARIDVESAGIHSMHGIAVGDRQVDVAKKLHNAKREPLDHVPEGITLVVEEVRGENGISFQFERGILVRMLSGGKMTIRIAEACM